MTTQAHHPTILVDQRGTRFHENENSDSKDVCAKLKLSVAMDLSEFLAGRRYWAERCRDRKSRGTVWQCEEGEPNALQRNIIRCSSEIETRSSVRIDRKKWNWKVK
jgi:hypothetical protein